MKIVFFVSSPFNQRDYNRYGIDILLENGFFVEVWDFTPFLTSEKYQRAKPPDPSRWDHVLSFQDKREALDAISALDGSAFVFSFIQYNLDSFPIYRRLTDRKILYGVHSSTVPISSTPRQLLARRMKRWSLGPRSLMNAVFNRIPFEFLRIKPADVIIARSEKYVACDFPVNAETKVLWGHSFDYDSYLEEKKKPVSVDADSGVFLDEYLPFHPDNALLDVPSPASPESYYPYLCSLFERLEKQYSVRIIIAAHPRAHYEDHPDYFGGRPVIQGKTAELIRKSGFVLMHTSSAMSYAVLFKKPIIIISTSAYNQGLTEDPTPEWIASFFGKETHYIDGEYRIDLQKELTCNEGAYDRYRSCYIKKDGSEEIPSWQIFANWIQHLAS